MARVHPLAKWFKTHTPEQNARLIKAAKTSAAYLRHVIAGRRSLSLELKIELEIAARQIDWRSHLMLGGGAALDRYNQRWREAKPGNEPSSL